jgi:hypothetical protein
MVFGGRSREPIRYRSAPRGRGGRRRGDLVRLWRWLPRSRSSRATGEVADPLGPKLAEHRWSAKAAELSETGQVTMALRLPVLIGAVLRLGWQAARRDLAVTVIFNVVSGIFTVFGLLATTGVLQALLAAGPTPARVAGAAPALLLVGAAVTARAGFAAIAQWAQARLRPQVTQIVERRLYESTTAVDLGAFDDPDFQDDLHRARIRGIDSAPSMVDNAVNLFTASVGVVAAAGALGALHPVLLPLLLLTALPEGWAAVRAARLGYLTQLGLVEVYRRSWIMTELMTERRHAAEVRSFNLRAFLLRRYAHLADHIRTRMLRLARRQTLTRIFGDALKGMATVVMYAALGLFAVEEHPAAGSGRNGGTGDPHRAKLARQPRARAESLLRRRPVLQRLPQLLPRRRTANPPQPRRPAHPDRGPDGTPGRSPATVRSDQRGARHLRLPRKRHPSRAKRVSTAGPR